MRTENQVRTALKSRPKVGLQHFDEGAAMHDHLDLYAKAINLGDFHVHVERFERKPGIVGDRLPTTVDPTLAQLQALKAANPHFELTGTNASDDDLAFDEDGGFLATTDGADGDGCIIFPVALAGQTWWNTGVGVDKQPWCDIKFKTGASLATMILWAGFKITATPVVATDADQAFLRYEDDVNSGRFQFVVSVGGVDTTIDTGVTPVVDTTYRLRIIIDEDRAVKCYLNGALIAEHNAALTAAAVFKPVWGVEADGAAAAATGYLRHIALAAYAA